MGGARMVLRVLWETAEFQECMLVTGGGQSQRGYRKRCRSQGTERVCLLQEKDS